MRLLAVRLQNLNSLSGALHEVRFDSPPLSQAGVFLITGPTGAGKSTVLDAVTLALYGRAARYGNDKADEMMSRHTSECLAEVDFQTHGQTLRATWRLGKTKSGNLKPVERRLADITTGNVLAEKGREMERLIEDLTGLDAQRFLRSVLLAQGQFAAFLKAKPNERAELLERITGTEIYSDLSVLAFETHKAKEDTAMQLRERIGALTVLTEEERHALEQQLLQAKGTAAALQEQATAANQSLNNLRQLTQQQRDLAAIGTEISKLTNDLATLATQQTEAANTATEAQTASAAAKQARSIREPIWEQAAKLTAQSDQLQTLLTESRGIFQAQAKEQKQALSRLDTAQKAQANHTAANQEIQIWLTAHAEDATLAERVTELRPKLQKWRTAHHALEQARRLHSEAKALTARQEHSQKTATELQAALSTEREKLGAQRATLENLTKASEEQRSVVDHAQRVAGFEDHRSDLEPGKPCPLCGAEDHPFASGTVNFASQLQAARRLLIALEQQTEKMRKDTAKLEQDIVRSEEKWKAETQKAAELAEAHAAIRAPDDATLAELQNAERQVQLPTAKSPDDAERDLNLWDERARAFNAKQITANEHQIQLQRLQAEVQLAAQDAEAKTLRLEELKGEGIALKARADTLVQSLGQLLGERTLTEDRQWHDQQVTAAEKTQRSAEAKLHSLQTKQAASEASRQQLEARRIDLQSKLADKPAVTPEVLTQIETSVAALAEQLASQQKTAGALEERTRHDDEARTRRQADDSALKTAEREALRWGRLKELIGSADGSKFARFAQSLTLRQLIDFANFHLGVLAPRYRLIAAASAELDLRIVDLYQAGTDRPMESLSGGESFLASLALALGLSELASRHHPIDSLFIDEGFGTLDAETLEVALSALENLHSQGKTIGLISHVETMKERIGTQIKIIRSSAGTSRIEVQ